jgi:hypothetical protein
MFEDIFQQNTHLNSDLNSDLTLFCYINTGIPKLLFISSHKLTINLKHCSNHYK